MPCMTQHHHALGIQCAAHGPHMWCPHGSPSMYTRSFAYRRICAHGMHKLWLYWLPRSLAAKYSRQTGVPGKVAHSWHGATAAGAAAPQQCKAGHEKVASGHSCSLRYHRPTQPQAAEDAERCIPDEAHLRVCWHQVFRPCIVGVQRRGSAQHSSRRQRGLQCANEGQPS